jgi:DNA replication protein DnaC
MEHIATDLAPPPNRGRTRTSSPSANTADPYLRVLEQIQDGTLEAAEADAEAARPCPACGGRGWIRRAVPVGDPDFGRAWPCHCLAPVLAQERLARLWGRAEIPARLADLSFASYAQTAGDQQARGRVERWAAEGEGSLYLFGRWGTGKTGLAVAAFRQRLELRGCDGLFRTSPDLLESIRATFDRATGGPTSSQVTDAVKTVTLLLLDDLGAEKLTEWVEERLYMILNYRYDRASATIYTSNLDLQQIGKRLSQRIAWRIKEMCEGAIVHVNGANLRDR